MNNNHVLQPGDWDDPDLTALMDAIYGDHQQYRDRWEGAMAVRALNKVIKPKSRLLYIGPEQKELVKYLEPLCMLQVIDPQMLFNGYTFDYAFDGIYWTGGEQLASLLLVQKVAREIGQWLKSSGLAAINLEYALHGPMTGEGWDDTYVFTQGMINLNILEPSGLRLSDELETYVSQNGYPLSDLSQEWARGEFTTDMLLSHNGYHFTSVNLTLRRAK